MTYNLIRYGVKDMAIAENRTLVAKVFEALEETKPQSLRYLVLELDNGEFIHLVGFDEDSSALTGLEAFKAFEPIMPSGARRRLRGRRRRLSATIIC
ncbi:hypothetical protein ACVDG8_018925 [Mesorhizobium sp. ORM8.1]